MACIRPVMSVASLIDLHHMAIAIDNWVVGGLEPHFLCILAEPLELIGDEFAAFRRFQNAAYSGDFAYSLLTKML